ncbi:IniB N-terminal domain-containing protein [Microbacterium sp. NPDC058062]|uniref:IniB N-terminal domain-containing protein n=1 Tax=Microbacterium sp. NPDC058062 TaxID=3346320 RepID=UPI0036DACD82
MTTPIETVADALIAFILSLLRDPNAVEEFNDDPGAAMAARGLQGACAADVRSVAPVIVDHPSVAPRPASSQHTHPPVGSDDDNPGGTPFDTDPQVIREISRIINQFTTIDARSTIVDQSTNQNIWTQGGDLTQIFDQSAVVAAGDGSVAAGDDVLVDESETTIGVGDVAVGNTTGSHNTTTTGDADDEADAPVDADVADPDAADTDAAASVLADPVLDDGLSQVTDAVDTAADAAATAATEAPAPAEPAPAEDAAPLMADMTDTSGVDAAEPLTPPEPEAYPDEPLEDQ